MIEVVGIFLRVCLSVLIALTLAQGPSYGAAAPTQLSVLPSTGIVVTQMVGGVPTPASFTYLLKSNRGSINWRITSKPPWLKASALSGKTSATLVLTVISVLTPAPDPQGLMPVGVYSATVVITASTNAVSVPAKLTVTVPPLPPLPPPSTGILLDGVGGALLDGLGGKLTAQ